MKFTLALSILINCCLLTSCNDLSKLNKSDSDKIIYDVVFRDNLAGTYEKQDIGNNSLEYYYTYTDRGRGPKYSEKITLSEKGLITSQEINGVNYRKTPMNESFSIKKSKATWVNIGGEKEVDFNNNKLYFRYDGTPAIYEILAKQLLKSKNSKIELYPKGEIELVKKFPLKLSNDTSLNLLMIKGLDMNPSYIWVKGDEMIGKIAGNLHVIREDFKSFRLEIKTLQDKIEDEYLIEIAKKCTHKVGYVVIKNVNVFTPKGTLLLNQDVFVENGIIKEIKISNKKNKTHDAFVIDGSGKTLLPGMFDMHTHNNKFRGSLYLAGGVTSVRDLANNKQLKALSTQFNKNEILGPRIVTFADIIWWYLIRS